MAALAISNSTFIAHITSRRVLERVGFANQKTPDAGEFAAISVEKHLLGVFPPARLEKQRLLGRSDRGHHRIPRSPRDPSPTGVPDSVMACATAGELHKYPKSP